MIWSGVIVSDTATVYVVDDDAAVRKSLGWLLESVGLRVETYATADLFLRQGDPTNHCCLVLDVRLPGTSGLELLEQIAGRTRPIPTIIITGHADVGMAVRAMKSGAVDFIEKPFSDQVLLERIQQALAGDMSRQAREEQIQAICQRAEELTPREREVLELIVNGNQNRLIAEKLEISQKTVEVHRARLMHKMQARGVADLVRMAVLAEVCSVEID